MKKQTLFVTFFFLILVCLLAALVIFAQDRKQPKSAVDIPQEDKKKEISIPPKKMTEEFTCPASGWVDCMPRVNAPSSKACTAEAQAWLKEHCPNYKGVAY